MKREYTINELASILGCSRTAIVKKIKPDENNQVLKRYRNRYEVVNTPQGMAILLDDIDLEHEKHMSKGVSNVSNNTGDKVENDNIIDIEPAKETSNYETLIEFTNRYIEQFTTFQKDMYNELKQRDNQILLLTTSEKTKEQEFLRRQAEEKAKEQAKEQEYLKTQAENKALKLRNRVLTVIIGVVITVLLIWITFYATYMTLNTSDDIQKNPAQQETLAKPVK